MGTLAGQQRVEEGARATALALGHKLGLFYFTRAPGGAYERAECIYCGDSASYAPNHASTTLAGPALASPCRAAHGRFPGI